MLHQFLIAIVVIGTLAAIAWNAQFDGASTTPRLSDYVTGTFVGAEARR